MQVMSASEIAEESGKSKATVYNWAKRLGIKPLYGFSQRDARKIEKAMNESKRGRPPEKKQKRSVDHDGHDESPNADNGTGSP